MKNLILVFAAIAISAGAYAQTDSINTKTNQGDMNNKQKQNVQNNPVDKSHPQGENDSTSWKTSPQDMNNTPNQNMQNKPVDKLYSDGVIMQNGKIMKVKNGQMTLLQEKSITMGNGTKIMSDGTCIKKDGTKMTMKEGQHMDLSGNLTDKNKNMYLVPDSTTKKDNNY